MTQTLAIDYPDNLPDSLHMTRTEFEREARLAMAVKLFETGKLSSGQAAQLADLPRVHFLYELSRFGVSSVQMDSEELEQDLATAQRTHDRHQQQSGH